MKLTIYKKLFLWSLIPFITLMLSLAYNLKQEYNNRASLSNLENYLFLRNHDSNIIFELALERGLTLLYRSEQTPHLLEKLHKQYQASDLVFKNAPSVLQQELFNYRNELHTIRKLGTNLNINSDTVFKKYSSLIKQIDSLHQFSRLNVIDVHLEKLLFGLEKVLQNKDTLGETRAYIAKILNTNNINVKDFNYVQELEHTLHVNFKLIQNAIKGTSLHEEFTQFHQTQVASNIHAMFAKILARNQQMQLSSKMKELIGYGGLIHNFYNYLLLDDTRYKTQFLSQYKQFNILSKNYKLLVSNSQSRYNNILVVQDAFKSYRRYIDLIATMRAQGRSSNDIVSKISVDDTIAIQAVSDLDRFNSRYNAEAWFDLASQNVKNIHIFEHHYLVYLQNNIQEKIDNYTSHIILHFIFALITIIAIIILNMFFARHFTSRITLLQEGLTSFFGYINHTQEHPQSIQLNSKDELKDMADQINQQVAFTQENREKDEDFIEETTHIVSLMQEGEFDEKSFYNPYNPSLQKLQLVFNELTTLIQDKIKAQTDELAMMNGSLEDTIYQQTLTLQEQIQNLNQLNTIMDTSAIVTKTDAKGTISHVNQRYLDITGFSEAEVLGQKVSFFIPNNTRKSQLPKMLNTINNREIFKGPLTLKTKEGSRIYIDAIVFPIIDHHDNVIEYIGIFTDITQHIQAKEVAIAAEKSKDEFLANMSHEIRTPLNAILGFVTILMKRIEDEKSLHYLNIVSKSGNSLLHIINDILDFSKIQSGQFTISPYSFSPIQEFSHATALFSSKVFEKNIVYAVYIDPSMPSCLYGDFKRVEQILNNITSNAIKFTPQDGTIKIKVIYEKGFIEIHVQDSGIGIPEAAQARIFNAFEQADGSTTREFGGTGLGLSISSKLAHLMDGTITLTSKENEGAHFIASIPMSVCDNIAKPVQYLDYLDNYTINLLNRCVPCQTSVKLMYQYLSKLELTDIKESEVFTIKENTITIFVPDEHYNQAIIDAKLPSIVLLREPSAQFDTYPHIVALLAPFVPTAIVNALEHFNTNKEISQLQENTQDTHEDQAIYFDGRVLVAEDNKTNQMLISLLLQEYHIDFTIVEDGEEAVDCYTKASFDLILMDENMPNLNGLGAFERIREYETSQQRSQTPIIALTASVTIDEQKKFIDTGFNGFVGKPIDTQELEAVLKKYLTMRAP